MDLSLTWLNGGRVDDLRYAVDRRDGWIDGDGEEVGQLVEAEDDHGGGDVW